MWLDLSRPARRVWPPAFSCPQHHTQACVTTRAHPSAFACQAGHGKPRGAGRSRHTTCVHPSAFACQVYKRQYWTETFIQWSPLGTYITTLHRCAAAWRVATPHVRPPTKGAAQRPVTPRCCMQHRAPICGPLGPPCISMTPCMTRSNQPAPHDLHAATSRPRVVCHDQPAPLRALPRPACPMCPTRCKGATDCWWPPSGAYKARRAPILLFPSRPLAGSPHTAPLLACGQRRSAVMHAPCCAQPCWQPKAKSHVVGRPCQLCALKSGQKISTWPSRWVAVLTPPCGS